MQIFSPLARLLGLYSIKEELEELAFQFTNPEAHVQMTKRMEALSKMQGGIVQAVRTFTLYIPRNHVQIPAHCFLKICCLLCVICSL